MEEAVAEYEDPIIKNGFSDLKAAILTGRTDIVRTILAAAQSYRDEDELFDSDDESQKDEKQFEADGVEILDLLQLLLNYSDHDAGTPLHYATKLGRPDMVRALLSAGANPTIRNEHGSTPFDYCKDNNVKNAYVGELMQAAAQSKIFRLKQLLYAGVDIDSGDGADSDNKVLHWAVSFGSHEMVKLLLDQGAEINTTNSDGASPLHDAVVRGDEEILAELLRRGADINICPFKGPLEGKRPYDLTADKPWLRELFHEELDLKPITVNGEVHTDDTNQIESTSTGETNTRLIEGSNACLSTVRHIRHDEEIILLAEENSGHSHRQPALTVGRSKDKSARNLLTVPLTFPVQPHFPTIVKVDSDVALLWPQPQKLSQYKGAFYVPPLKLTVVIISTDRFKDGLEGLLRIKEIWEQIVLDLKVLGFDVNVEVHSVDSEYSFIKGAIYCSLDPLVFSKSEEYKLNFTTDKVNIVAKDGKSMYNAVLTFLQCMRIYQGKGIPLWQIHDWPTYTIRGVVLDFNDGFLPNADIMINIIENICQFKPTQIYLPINLFLQSGQRSPPYSRRNLIDILEICGKRFVDVMPLVRISLDQSGDSIVRFLQMDVFPLFPMSRYIFCELENSYEPNRQTEEKAGDGNRDLWSLILDLHQTCTSNARALIVDADIILQFPQRLPRVPHGLICSLQKQSSNSEYTCERLKDLGLPFIVCPEIWSPLRSESSVCPHIHYAQNIINSLSSYDPIGVLVRCKMYSDYISSVTLATICLGYSIGHTWKAFDSKSTRISFVVDIVNRHILQDQCDLLGAGLVTMLTLNTAGLDTNARQIDLDVFSTDLLLKMIKGDSEAKASQKLHHIIQQSVMVFKRCISIAKNSELKCKESNFIRREVHVLCTILLFLCRLYKNLLNTCGDSALSLDTLTAVQRSDMSNKLLNLVEQYKGYYQDYFCQGWCSTSLSFLQELLSSLHPSSSQITDLSRGIKTI